MRIIFIEGINDLEEPEVEWHKKWIDFVKNTLSIENQPELDKESDEFERDTAVEWINSIAEKFTDSKTAKNWRYFVKKMTGEDV